MPYTYNSQNNVGNLSNRLKKYTAPEISIENTKGGNRYSLPFGLCKSVGIDTTGMTPREAWAAYTDKTGITKEEAEKKHWDKTEKKEERDKTSQDNRTEIAQKRQPTTDKTIKRSEDIKNKSDLVDYIKQRHNIELENDPNEMFNRKRTFLYTKIPKGKRIEIVGDLKKHGFIVDSHLNDYYWISVKPVRRGIK